MDYKSALPPYGNLLLKTLKSPDSMRKTAEEFSSYCEQAGIISIPIENKHIFALKDLPASTILYLSLLASKKWH